MAKRVACLLLALCLGLLLAGCSGLGIQNVNDLLQAPALGQGLDEIQDALAAYLNGPDPQYKYPRDGDWRSPLILADLDGSGSEEAVLLYGVSDSTAAGRERGGYVYVAVLENEDGIWQVKQDVQGLGSDVASLEVVDLLGDGTKQLVVGYSNRMMGIYSYQESEAGSGDDVLKKLYEIEYSRYEVGDFTGRGGIDMVVVTPDKPMRLRYVPTLDGQFQPLGDGVNLDSNFEACVGITASELPNGERLLVIDGVSGSAEGPLSSQYVYYKDDEQRFYTVDDGATLRGATGRTNQLLLSRDIDGDGIAETPKRVGSEIITPADQRFEFVEWVDYTDIDEGAATKRFGLLDSGRGVYIGLPDSWRGEVAVVDGDGEDEWKLQRKRTGATLLTLRVLDVGDAAVPGAVRVPGTVNSYLAFGSLPQEEREAIQMLNMM